MKGDDESNKDINKQQSGFENQNNLLKQMHMERMKRIEMMAREDQNQQISECQLVKIHKKIEEKMKADLEVRKAPSLEKQILLNMVIYDKRPTKPNFMINFYTLFQDEPVGKALPYISKNIEVVMLTTFGFEMQTFRFLIQSQTKCFIINDSDLKQTKIFQNFNDIKNFTVIERARKVTGYGVSHTKLWLIKFKKFLRVVVCTSNQHIMDWTIWQNAYWYQDFPLKDPTQETINKSVNKQSFDYDQDFSNTLTDVANNLLPDDCYLQKKIGINLKNYLFKDIKSILIPSFQGKFTDDKLFKIGMNKVGRVIRTLNKKFNKPIMTYASTSLGAIDSKFVGQLFGKFCPGVIFTPNKFRLVYPTERYINQETCQQAQILFLMKNHYEKCDIKSQIFHKFDTNPQNPILGCLPHLKIIFIEEADEDNETGLLFMGSHNSTRAAWGKLQKSNFHVNPQIIPKFLVAMKSLGYCSQSIQKRNSQNGAPSNILLKNIQIEMYPIQGIDQKSYDYRVQQFTILILVKLIIMIETEEMVFEQNYLKCLQLQRKLKNEYLLLMTEQDQKANFQKKLANSLNNFYRNFVHFDLTYNDSSSSKKTKKNQKQLFEDEGFGNCYIFIKDIILILSKSPQLCLKLVEKHNSWHNVEVFDGIVKVFTNSMFQNIVDEDLNHKDILFFINGILQLIVDSKSKYYKYSFHEQTLICKILREFMRKQEYKNYTDEVVKGTLLQIAKLDHVIDFKADGQEDSRSLTTKKTYLTRKNSESPVKKKPTAFKNVNTSEKATSKVEIYCAALKKKDIKIRTSTMIRTKNRNCASSDLLRFLGIIDNINFPIFSCVSSETQLKQEQRVNEQWSLLLNKKQSDSGNSSYDITLLKNLVFTFFGDVFKMLYSMPMMIRVICKILYDKILLKYENNQVALIVLGNFVLSYWICQSLKIDDLLFETGRISQYTNQNLSIIRKAVAAVILKDYSLVDQAFHAQFNLIISNLRLSVFNYLSELVNIQLPKIDRNQQVHQIKSHSVCLSIADAGLLIKMITNTPSEQITSINDKILKKVKKISQISDGADIFGDRTDKATNKTYKNDQSFVLFSEVVFPKDLSYDYMKSYNDAFKKQKLKNTLRQVLLNIADLNDFYEFPNDCQKLDEFFDHILKSRQERLNLNAIDHIPVQLKINYLLTLSRSNPIQLLLDSMISEADARLKMFKEVWDRSKQYYLKAISSVISQTEKISINESTLEQEAKKQKLNEFMAKFKINLCLTSPRTRQKEIVLKTNVMGDINEQERQKIWLQHQSKCMHTALNLDFIKSLTGEAETPKIKYESHFKTANKFAEVFCSLPQVKENGMSGEDNYGIMQILQHFTSFCIDSIKAEPFYEQLANNGRWLQQNLEQKITKKIYDKLYPKHPTFQDLAFYLRIKTLDWISYDHLKIQPIMRVSGMWDIAAKILKQVERVKTASEKLDKILQCNKIIVKSYSLVGDANQAITPDDIFPIVVYILIKAAPRRITSNISFIEMYANKNKLMSRDGYFLTQMKSAIMYLQNLSHEDLGMGMIEFNKKIYEKEIEYGIYFMTPRRRNSPRTTQRKIQYLKQHYFGSDYKPSSQISKAQNEEEKHYRKNSQGKICVCVSDELS